MESPDRVGRHRKAAFALCALVVAAAAMVTIVTPGRAAEEPGVQRLFGGLGAPCRTSPTICLSGFDDALAPHCTLTPGPLPDAAALCPGHVHETRR